MSKLTNKLSLPTPIVKAIEADPYDAGKSDISTTRLIAPPRVVELTRRHRDEIVEDVSDRIYSLVGQIGHLILERAAEAGSSIAEKRYFAERKGWTISGQVDLILDGDNADLVDYKFVSLHSSKDGIKKEWEQQLNISRWLARENGQEIHSAAIVAVFRDWSKVKSIRDADHPKAPVQVFPARMWKWEEIEAFIDHRLDLHQAARATEKDDDIEICSEEDRWAKPPKWAVYKGANKRATKLADSMDEAEEVAATIPQSRIEYRPGESTRCIYYCPVNSFCKFYRENVAPNLNNE